MVVKGHRGFLFILGFCNTGQALLQFSYIGRMGGMFLVWFLCHLTGLFNLIALVLPMLFTQPIITIADFFRKSGEKKA